MNEFDLKKVKKIYVLCPTEVKTGGTELLHQLVFSLNKIEKKAFITYISENNNVKICEGFEKYITEYKIKGEIEDNEDNIVIIPERYSFLARSFKKCKKAIWWLSVDNYLIRHDFKFTLKYYGLKIALKVILRKISGKNVQLKYKELKQKIDIHFVQSYYAYDFLKKIGICSYELTDYINDDYLNIKMNECKKENIIVYNPKKGYKYTKKIIKEYKKIYNDANWIAIENMKNSEVKELLKKSKVYIDFGNFPGKDRIPREAALAFNCIISGKFGASKYNNDLSINEKYKFGKINVKKVCDCIHECIKHYEIENKNFEEYRLKILQEKKNFEDEVKCLFFIDERDVKVSILCMVYNHEKYLDKCLESFVNQKTNFKYEILVNDDASTDKSKEIIQKYKENYPNLFTKVFFQKENLFSKNIKITEDILLPQAEGKYIALCEGDDFWNSDCKLQTQYDFMENNLNCSMCVHNSYIHNLKTGKYTKFNKWKKIRCLSEKEVFFGWNFHTSSYFIRKEYGDISNFCREYFSRRL